MWLFPYRRFVITTDLNSDGAIQQITNNINILVPGSLKFLRRANDFEKYFFGRIDNNIFKIHRAIKGRNSVLPFIKGQIISQATGSRIIIRMRLHPVILIFCLWILIIDWFNKSSFQHIVFTYNNTGLFIFFGDL